MFSLRPMGSQEFVIATGDLDSGGKRYLFPVRASWIRGVLEEHEATPAGMDGSLDVRASSSGNDVVVHGTLKASLHVPCARCLEPVPFQVDEAVSVLFVPKVALNDAGGARRGHRRDDDHEMTTAEADTLPYEGEAVVLDDLVRDELILQTPSFPLCSEDCPGISPSLQNEDGSGPSTEEVDPRLLPLMRILDHKE
jgi:uncharacterized protein